MDGLGIEALQESGQRFPAWLRMILIGALLGRPALAGTLTPAPAVHDIDWRTSPLDLNLRGLNGERFRFHCPSGKAKTGQVVGKGPYTDGSSICAAAVHAGVIHAASGGLVTIELRPGEAHYEASWSHFIQSSSYDRFWGGSFLILASDAAESTDGRDTPLTGPDVPPGSTFSFNNLGEQTLAADGRSFSTVNYRFVPEAVAARSNSAAATSHLNDGFNKEFICYFDFS